MRSHSQRPCPSVFSRIRRGRSRSPRQRSKKGGVFKRLGSRGKIVSARSNSYNRHSHSRYTEALSESEDSGGGHWNSRSKKKKSSGEEDDLSQPWVCEEIDPFTPRIRYFDFPKTRMPSHIKTYDGSEDQEDHLKIFQAAAKTERWAMPTWCHMFNSTLIGNVRVWFDDLPPESIDSYDDLKEAFLENYLQQKKYIKDPIELHNIKQRDGESTKDFVRRYKLENRDVKGAPECMRISGFVHGITNPELIKRLHDKIPKTVDEMMRVTTSFLRGEVAALNHERKKIFPPWKHHQSSQKQNFKKRGHNTDECMHLRKQIEEMLRAGKLSHLIKEIKQNNGKEQPKVTKKGETSGKDKALTILMIQPWERVARQRITHSFSPNPEIFFPPHGEDEGAEGPMIIDAEIGGHCVHRQIQILVKIEDKEHSASAWMNFMVMRSQSPYNGIIGRQGVRKLQARNLDIFAWKPANMTDVPRHIAEHRLNVREGCSPVRQKKRGQATDKNQSIQEEVGKLVGTGIMREIHYHDWLSNPVMVKNITAVGGCMNAGATYQRLVDKSFHKQIGRNLKVYVDDLLIKICTEDEIVIDVEETFKTLREINMKLNPKKCAFGVEERMSLGYKVNAKGLKVCPDKVDAVLSLPSPKYLRDVQKLHKKLARLNSDFHWTTEAKEAFKQMKQLIAEFPMLTAPMEKEELIVYLATTKETVSAVLMTESEAKQMPIYFVSRALRGPELNYTSMEKLVLALVHDSKRLKRYFQAHPVIVVTDQPVQQILSRPKVARRLHKWSIELGEYAIHYRPRVSVKGQILADFIVERPEEDSPDTPIEAEGELPEPWILFTDESSCTDSSGAGLILTNPRGMEFTYALRFRFDATNNKAKYEALIAGLRIAEQMGVKNLQANVDSRLVANQVNETYVSKEADMIRYLKKVKALTGSIRVFSIKQIPRSENKKSDALSKIASTSFAHLSKQGTLPADVKKAKAIRRKSWRFAVINETLYKKSFLGIWLRCVGPLQANYVLREIHEGSCSMHAGTRSVVAKALRTGYYWPTMHKDARTLIRAGQDCQVYKPVPRNPQQKLTPITSSWPFYKWGIDIAGPFPEGPGKVKFLIVAMDYLREGIKARLDARSKNWMEELPHVLWAHRTMIKFSNEDTPFLLTYETEAVIPAEIGMPMLRTAEVYLVGNNEALKINLDLLEERRDEASIREAKSKAKMEKYYNSKVRNTSFKPGDLVYRNNDASRAEDTGKLGPKWEGPYDITEALGKGAYKLRDRERKQLSRT
uniref:Reverse transcriptase domain-containing protein n=1 Tax=Tanacetum cinerariifolium TaxID=118510 RepID=A0A6L2N9T8_TANCI|nr:reverse transcriptase domain-containing protein [Tanacetum cinerariifolium]